ncbi:hypothetical protein POPTR_014G002301v4 [Populus trichocarpa]|uniref:Disease resistance protein RGA3 n=1 Tax=Populus trichocarpa TaxID=3694 RepID=U5FQT4_POPTR|nr:hypothetical protein POPTR_014G002301v4 [Populus trichocarpa]
MLPTAINQLERKGPSCNYALNLIIPNTLRFIFGKRGSFFLSGEANAVALLYGKKRRERKKREKMSSPREAIKNLCFSTQECSAGQGNIRTVHLRRLPLYLQASSVSSSFPRSHSLTIVFFLCYCFTMSFWKFIGI